MKDKIKEILINRLGQVVKDEILEDLSAEIDQVVRHSQFLQSGKNDNITIGELIDNTARVGDVFKYGDEYYEVIEDNTKCGFSGMNCDICPFDKHGCVRLKGFKKL